MKAEYINPFVESVSELFENMLDCPVEMGSVGVASLENKAPDIIGVIGLSGTAQAIVAIAFPVNTALKLVGRMVGEEFRSVDSSIIDGVGELVNIIAGGAMIKLEGHSLALSLPTVLRGSVLKLSNLENTVWLEVPFTSDLGDFSLAVSFRPSAKQVKEEAVHESISSR